MRETSGPWLSLVSHSYYLSSQSMQHLQYDSRLLQLAPENTFSYRDR